MEQLSGSSWRMLFLMRMNDMTPAMFLRVACPTCGVAIGDRCLLSAGGLRSESHVDRKLCEQAFQFLTERNALLAEHNTTVQFHQGHAINFTVRHSYSHPTASLADGFIPLAVKHYRRALT